MATLAGTNAAETITGTEAADTINAFGGADLVFGLGGDDFINAGVGNDTASGGDGNDVVIGSNDQDVLHGDAGNDTLAGGAGNDLVYGDAGDDQVLGDPGDDQLWGGDGNDEVRGGQNRDWLNGGAGDDLLAGSPGSDTFAFHDDPAMGLDTIEDFTFGDGDRLEVDFDPAAMTFRDSPAGLILTFGGIDFAVLTGFTAGSFTLDWFVPLAAPIRDTVTAPNVFNGTSGADTMTGSGGNDLLNAVAGDDTVNGNGGDDWIDGSKGNDTLSGGDGNDIIYGGVGVYNDNIQGGAGDDLIFTGNGTNRVDAGEGQDLVFGAPGRDFLNGSYGADQLHGEDGNDTLTGAQGKDSLFGGAGADILLGGGDDDLLVGGAGADSLSGQAGADLFLLGTDARDKLADFSFAQGDRIALAGVADLPAFLAEVAATDSAEGLVLSHAGQSFALLAGHTTADFSGQWFVDAPIIGAPLYPGDSPPANRAPVLSLSGAASTTAPNELIAVASLVQWSDPDGDTPLLYQVEDLSADKGSGRFVTTVHGADSYLRPGLVADMTLERFADLRADEGAVVDVDSLYVRAFDGALWSDWLLIG